MFDPKEKVISGGVRKDTILEPVEDGNQENKSSEKNERVDESSPRLDESKELSNSQQQDEPQSGPLLSTKDSPVPSSASTVDATKGEATSNLIGRESHTIDLKKPPTNSSPQAKNTKSYEFRREYSKDHPLAGGKGEYFYERSQGLVPVGCYSAFTPEAPVLEDTPRRVSVVKTELIVEPVKQFLKYKEDLERLLRQVLEEEELAEQDRMAALSMKYEDKEELEMIMRAIQDDRARASSRIKAVTDDNERRLKEALAYLLLDGEDI